MSKWIYRPIQTDDVQYITSTWLRSNYRNSKFAKSIPSEVYYAEHNILINQILGSGSIVACDPELPSHIFGYLIGSNLPKFDVIHYVYVKRRFQGFKMAAGLVEEFKKAERCLYSHKNDMTKSLVDNLLKSYSEKIYNPYRFFNNE